VIRSYRRVICSKFGATPKGPARQWNEANALHTVASCRTSFPGETEARHGWCGAISRTQDQEWPAMAGRKPSWDWWTAEAAALSSRFGSSAKRCEARRSAKASGVQSANDRAANGSSSATRAIDWVKGQSFTLLAVIILYDRISAYRQCGTAALGSHTLCVRVAALRRVDARITVRLPGKSPLDRNCCCK